MLAIDCSLKEVFNQLTRVRWEWLLATIILTAKLFKSRLACDEPFGPELTAEGLSRVASRSHTPKTDDDVLLTVGKVTRNPILETGAWFRTSNPEP
jgi:hypothetical protein